MLAAGPEPTGAMSRLTGATLLMLSLLLAAAPTAIVGGLQVGFYNRTCPEAEQVVRDVVVSNFRKDPTIAPGLLRIFFHDCFITGCDASLLLDETPSGEAPEKASPANSFTLHGLRTIDVAKKTIEAMCPRTVSCADILAFAARDAAVEAGLVSYDVAAGRRDGTRSRMDDLPGNFPIPAHTCPRLTELFGQRGLTQEDLVVLSGAHSIGGAHCFMFSNRIYGFSEQSEVDPALPPEFAARLRQLCPQPKPEDDPVKSPKIPFDQATAQRLDNAYYAGLLAGHGLLTSDDALVKDPQTRPTVEALARDDALFQRKFAEAMQKVGMIDVLVGQGNGQIRTDCREVNGMLPNANQNQRMPMFSDPRFPWAPRHRHPMLNRPRQTMFRFINWFTRARGFH